MRTSRARSCAVALAGAALLLAACGGGDDGDAADTTSAPTTAAGTTAAGTTAAASTTAAVPDGLVTSVDDIKQAVVQVLTEGEFRDPAEGTQASQGSGSGFIIDPDGIVVTNNHVVTGAGAVKVRIGGSEDEVPARVLGVSECNDLAVLQIGDPGPYPYVAWYDGDIAPPLEVFAAGFPLGDPEFTITRGVVSKAEADGQTPWASVRRVIEHDANIQPGNSGGPLVNQDGQVVGVNYAGGDPGTGTSQFFAISADLASAEVERLQDGNDLTIGVNGESIESDDGTVGVWVAGVEAGSPAAKAGVLPGDVITKLNGVEMSPGTMEAYCDVLRSSNADEAIGIEVVRPDTQEIWVGELNGTPMVARFSFAQELEGELPANSGGTTDPAAPAEYTYEEIQDDTGQIAVRVPVEWAERTTAPSTSDTGAEVPSIVAAPNLEAFQTTYVDPGMSFQYAPAGAEDFTPDQIIDGLAPTDCEDQGRQDYSDAVFTGRQQYWLCQDTSLVVIVAASPTANPGAKVAVTVQAVSDADLKALDEVLLSFNVA